MTRALALETTSRRAAVALVEGVRVVAEDAFAAGLNHTAGLLPMVEALVRRQGWTPRDLDHVYVSVGPGGFTGTRVGVTLAKTFAFATGAKLVAVPTPRVIVENLTAEARTAAVVVDARRGKIWTQRFERGDGKPGRWLPLDAGGLTTMADLAALLPRPAWLVGEGVAYHNEPLASAEPGLRVWPDAAPDVAVVATLGTAAADLGRFADPFALTPVYVRRPEAEEKRLEAAAETA